MNRAQIALASLAAILVVVLFWLLLYSPKSDEIAEVRDETEAIERRQTEVSQQIAALEEVRENAPEQEAVLSAAHSIIPTDSALPAFLRQLQTAADDAGMELRSVSPTRPVEAGMEEAGDDLFRISVSTELEGTYFQLVDLLRRVEDPSITPRSIHWNSISIGGDPESHPTLQISLQGELYAVLPTGSAQVDDDEPTDPEEQTDDDADADVDVEVEENDSE